MKYKYTEDGLINPEGLTPEELYKLQSETWAQGAEFERVRILKLLEKAGYIVAFELREGDPAIWDGEKWIELTEGEKK